MGLWELGLELRDGRQPIDGGSPPTPWAALVLEAPAQFPYSWHDPKRPLPVGNDLPVFKDAKNLVGFVDGHVSYIKIFWNTNLIPYPGGLLISMASDYDPPAGYEYQWSGD